MDYICKGCNKRPDEIKEYIQAAKIMHTTPDRYVEQEEGTLNRKTGQFYCTKCYIANGMPLGKA